MSGPSKRPDQEVVTMDIEVRTDQFDEIARRVTDDAARSAAARRILDLGLAELRRIERQTQGTERPI